MSKYIIKYCLFALLIGVGGCAKLPDLNRLQSNMEQMTMYMGMMVNTTGSMAAAAERLEKKSDRMIANLEKKGGSAERAIQNYSQALLDNERAVIKNLQGIRQELSEVKTSMQPTAGTQSLDAAQIANIQRKLLDLEKKLSVVTNKIEAAGPR